MASRRKDTDHSSLAGAASEQVRTIIEAAEQTAAQIRAEAEEEAARIRARAEEEASGISNAVRGDVQTLLESLREGVSRLNADFAQLEDKLGAESPDEEAAAPPPPSPSPPPPPSPKAAERAAPEPAPAVEQDTESARLVALNMALDGASRDEVDRYLSENFELANRKTLLDDVYASIGS
jgi:cell division septum initiation protein DivIVA